MLNEPCPPHVPMEFPGGAYPIMTFRDFPVQGDKHADFPETPEVEHYFGKQATEHELPPLIGRVWICSKCKLLYFHEANPQREGESPGGIPPSDLTSRNG